MDERTAEILDRFIKSWSDTEKFYDDLITNYPGLEKLKPLRQYISALIQQREDKYFRAGTSLHMLILSRSVDFGLRKDQKYLKIETIDANDFEVILRDGGKVYREYRINNLNDYRLTNLLQTLKHTLVD
jgi:hypothetical protein